MNLKKLLQKMIVTNYGATVNILRDRTFLIPGTRAEQIWVGYEKFLTIFDGARKIFATILWGGKKFLVIKCIRNHGDYSIAEEQY